MARRFRGIQTNFTSGELDPRMRARIDVTHYFNGAEKMRNARPLPQGGMTRRPGSKYRDTIFKQITRLTGTMTMPNGGTVATIEDENDQTTTVTTTNVGVVDPYVVAHMDLGSARTVKNASVFGVQAAGTVAPASTPNEFKIQSSTDDVAWTDRATMPTVENNTAGNRERSVATAFTTAVVARFWRFVKIGGTDWSTDKVDIRTFDVYEESVTVSNVRQIGFEFSTTQTYMIVVTDKNLAIYKTGVFQANIRHFIPHAALLAMSWVQSLDTLFLFHEDHATMRVLRTSDTDWTIDLVPYVNIPDFDFGAGNEDGFSETRGWPKCGTFHEGRFWVAGHKSRPTTFNGSKVGLFFDFDLGTALDDEGIEGTLDTDDVAAIFNLNSGRHLQIFTQSSEFFVLPNDSAKQPSNIVVKRSTQAGSLGPGLPVVTVEGGVFFVQRGGSAVLEFLFTDVEQAYQNTPVSLLSSHLLNTPIDFARKRSDANDKVDSIFVVNTDGTVAVYDTLRSQDINAWSLWSVDGKVVSIGVDFETAYWVAERTINGTSQCFLEELDETVFVDAAVTYAGAFSTLTGLDHLDGEACRVRADGSMLGNETPVAGSVTPDRAVVATAQVGLDFPDLTGNGDGVQVRDMPFEGRQDFNMVGILKRVVNVDLPVLSTRGFFISVNGRPAREITFRQFGDPLDDPPPLVTKDVQLKGFLGFTTLGQVEITQRDPVEMTILALSKEVATR